MSESITYKNTPLYYRKTGQGPWIVLLHGFMESMEIWNEFAEMLSSEFSIIMIDLPGHGRSGMLGEVHSIHDMADAVSAVLYYEGINDFVVCGHSMGGYIAGEMASWEKTKAKGLCLFHSHLAPDDEQGKENRRRTINIVKLNHGGFIRQFIPDLFADSNKERLAGEIEKLVNRASSTSSKSIIASLEGMKDRNGSLDFLIHTELPVYFVVGRNDSRMPYNKVVAQAMLGRNVELMLLDNVGHMGYLEAPEKIFPALRDYFRRCLK